MFLNCNYPNKCKIPKGRPKEVTPRTIQLEIKQQGVSLYVLKNGNVYFNNQNYYLGIELPKFLKKNMFGVNIFATIGAINIALLEWGDGREHLSYLNRIEEELLQKYLLTIK